VKVRSRARASQRVARRAASRPLGQTHLLGTRPVAQHQRKIAILRPVFWRGRAAAKGVYSSLNRPGVPRPLSSPAARTHFEASSASSRYTPSCSLCGRHTSIILLADSGLLDRSICRSGFGEMVMTVLESWSLLLGRGGAVGEKTHRVYTTVSTAALSGCSMRVSSKSSDFVRAGRWTLGFPAALVA
jgi:hypothetical protein